MSADEVIDTILDEEVGGLAPIIFRGLGILIGVVPLVSARLPQDVSVVLLCLLLLAAVELAVAILRRRKRMRERTQLLEASRERRRLRAKTSDAAGAAPSAEARKLVRSRPTLAYIRNVEAPAAREARARSERWRWPVGLVLLGVLLWIILSAKR